MVTCQETMSIWRSWIIRGAALAAVLACLTALTTEAASGPVAYYPFNGSIQDSSGFGNHAVFHGAVPTADRFGNPASGYLFDETGYLAAPDSDSLDIDAEFTVAVWFRLDALVSMFGVFAGKGANSAYSVSVYYGGSLVCNDPTAQPLRQIQVSVGGASNRFTSGPSFACGTGVWHHVAVTVRTEASGHHTANLYVNGSYADTKNLLGSFTNNASPLGIGKDGENAYKFAGAMDDLRLYDRELTATEIAELYNSLFVDGFESGTLAAWHSAVQ